GQVGGGAKAKTMDGGLAMAQFDRLKRRPEQLQRTVDAVHLNPGDAAVLVGCVKDVAKNTLQRLGRTVVGVKRNFLRAAKAQRAHIIEPQDVIGVGVGVDDGVDVSDVLANGLLAKVGRGIDEDALPLVLHHDRRPGAPVTRVRGVTHGTSAANGRHTHGGAATQDGKRRLHFLSGPGPAGDLTAAVARAFVISIHAIRNSNSTFCRRVCSRSFKLPLVFSCRMLRESMVCLAPIMSTAGGSPSWRMAPSCSSAVM